MPMPQDSKGNTMPAIGLVDGGAHKISATVANSARNANAFKPKTCIVSVYATGPVFIKFGGSDVAAAATDHYFPEGIYYDFAVGSYSSVGYPANIENQKTHLAVRAVTGNCDVYISEKE